MILDVRAAAQAVGSVIALVVVALAVGALAVGALAVGALAVGSVNELNE
jgi:hypothetical protein